MAAPQVIHMMFGGPIYSIHWGKKIGWRFEMHRYCGPVVVDRKDEPLSKQPGEGSGFWKAVTNWDQQGRRIAPHSVCIYDYERELR